MRESLLTAGTVATQLQRTDTKLLFIPVIFIILRMWDVIGNVITVYAAVDNPPSVSYVIRLLAVSIVLLWLLLGLQQVPIIVLNFLLNQPSPTSNNLFLQNFLTYSNYTCRYSRPFLDKLTRNCK